MAQHIDSVIRLEVLLLLHSSPRVCMSADDIAKELRINPEWVSATLPALEAAETLNRVESAYCYSPRTPELDQTIDALARAYAERRVTLISIIFATRVDPITQFTDAFRFKKSEKE